MNSFSFFNKQRHIKNKIEQLRPRLYRLALAWCHKPELADDLVQETMLKALNKYQQLKKDASIDSWMFSILNNCLRDHYRKEKDTDNIDDMVFIDHVTPVTHMENKNIVDSVRSAIATLPLGQKQVVTLVDLEEFSYAQVAEKLNIPIGTVMSRLCRARTNLAEKLMDLRSTHSPKRISLRSVK